MKYVKVRYFEQDKANKICDFEQDMQLKFIKILIRQSLIQQILVMISNANIIIIILNFSVITLDYIFSYHFVRVKNIYNIVIKQ